MTEANRSGTRTIPRVKQIKPRILLAELKDFAFEQSPGFRNGAVTGFELGKEFYFRDEVPLSLFKRVGREYRSSKFNFGAYRMPLDGPRVYGYQLSTSIERSLPGIPPLLLPHIPPKKVATITKGDSAKSGMIREVLSTALYISDYEPNSVSIQNCYTLSYMGKTLLNRDADSFSLEAEGDFVDIPSAESKDGNPAMFVYEPITHEQIGGADGVVNGINFWDVIEPLDARMEIDSFNAGARAIRTIVNALRTGEVL